MSEKKSKNLRLSTEAIERGLRLARERGADFSGLVEHLINAEWETPRLSVEKPSPGYLATLREVAKNLKDDGKRDLGKASGKKGK